MLKLVRIDSFSFYFWFVLQNARRESPTSMRFRRKTSVLTNVWPKQREEIEYGRTKFQKFIQHYNNILVAVIGSFQFDNRQQVPILLREIKLNSPKLIVCMH